MTFDEIICEAVAFLNVPVAELVYQGDAEDYCTYNRISEKEVEYGDDEGGAVAGEFNLHFFTRGNPETLKRRIWKALRRREDFYIHSAQILYDTPEQDQFHVVFDVSILNPSGDEFADEIEQEGEHYAV